MGDEIRTNRELASELAQVRRVNSELIIFGLKHHELVQRISRMSAQGAVLQELTSALSSARDPGQVAEVLVSRAVDALQASSGSLCVPVEGGAALEELYSRDRGERKLRRWNRLPIDAPLPLPQAARTGEPVFVETIEERNARFPLLRGVKGLEEAFAVVPMAVEGRLIGGLSVGFPETRCLAEEDRSFLLALAQQGAEALERLRILEAERRGRIEAEAALREFQEQQEGFLRTVAHDLRGPLTAIRGHAQLMQRLLGRQEELATVDRSLTAVVANTRRMDAAIQDLVDAVRFEIGQLQLQRRPTELKPLLRDLLERLAAGIDVPRTRMEVPDGLPAVDVDPSRLERILANLLGNGLRFSPPEAEVVVSAEVVDGDVMVTVTDRSAGIPEEDLGRVFDRYYHRKSDGKAEGLTLGLFVARRLVESHGGRIWVESDPARGSRFHFTVPVGGEGA